MGVDAATPPGLWDRIRQMIQDEVGKLLRSGLLRNASISEGGLTIKGGFLRLLDKDSTLFYVGPYGPDKADGTPQQGWFVARADGTPVLALFDANPTDTGGALNQALNWVDRRGDVVLADDTDGGEGLARPWLPLPMPMPSAVAQWSSTNATSWAPIAYSYASMQHPKVYWVVEVVADAGTTGKVRLNINNGETIGPEHTITTTAQAYADTITLPAGFFTNETSVLVEVEAEVTSGTGKVWAQTRTLYGRQT